MTLNVNPHSTLMSSLLRPIHPPEGAQAETVQVMPLDSFLPSFIEVMPEPRVFLKIDAEGYDLSVFRGAAKTLQYVVGLQAELYAQPVYARTPHYLDALQVYEDEGFELTHLSVVSRTSSGEIECMDCLMKRAVH